MKCNDLDIRFYLSKSEGANLPHRFQRGYYDTVCNIHFHVGRVYHNHSYSRNDTHWMPEIIIYDNSYLDTVQLCIHAFIMLMRW
jgi:hypothetical protein